MRKLKKDKPDFNKIKKISQKIKIKSLKEWKDLGRKVILRMLKNKKKMENLSLLLINIKVNQNKFPNSKEKNCN